MSGSQRTGGVQHLVATADLRDHLEVVLEREQLASAPRTITWSSAMQHPGHRRSAAAD